MLTLRTVKTEEAYQKKMGNIKTRTTSFDPATEPVLKEFNHWLLIPNRFPYDFITEKHEMLVPKRLFGSLGEANQEELHELNVIKKELGKEYHYIMESINPSVFRHLHLHVIKIKEDLPL